MSYDVYSNFDFKLHKKNFINYCEVVIHEDGTVHYAVPSHQTYLENYLCKLLNKDIDEVRNLCPQFMHFDYLWWLLGMTKCISVWTDFSWGRPNKLQQKTLDKLLEMEIITTSKEGRYFMNTHVIRYYKDKKFIYGYYGKINNKDIIMCNDGSTYNIDNLNDASSHIYYNFYENDIVYRTYNDNTVIEFGKIDAFGNIHGFSDLDIKWDNVKLLCNTHECSQYEIDIAKEKLCDSILNKHVKEIISKFNYEKMAIKHNTWLFDLLIPKYDFNELFNTNNDIIHHISYNNNIERGHANRTYISDNYVGLQNVDIVKFEEFDSNTMRIRVSISSSRFEPLDDRLKDVIKLLVNLTITKIELLKISGYDIPVVKTYYSKEN